MSSVAAKLRETLVDNLAKAIALYTSAGLLAILGLAAVPDELHRYTKFLLILDQQQANLAVLILAPMIAVLAWITLSDRPTVEKLQPDNSFAGVLVDAGGFQYCPSCRTLLSHNNKIGLVGENARYCPSCETLYERSPSE